MKFDEVIDRCKSGALKYDFLRYKVDPQAIPMWVADMDFRAPQEVNDAIIELAKHGIYGYTENLPGYNEAVMNWYKTHFKWSELKDEWNVKTPGVVFAITCAIDAFTNVGDTVIIQEPVYPPFAHVPKEKGRKLVINELILENGRYVIDFEGFEKLIVENSVKLFILCSPHNPAGRVWEESELLRLAEICLKHGVYIFSDEIHSDFVFSPNKHSILAKLSEDISAITITSTSPSKTFNLAGLQVSNNFIKNKELRNTFIKAYSKSGYSQLNAAGLMAAKAAYLYGETWLSELMVYLKGNVDFVRERLKGGSIDLIEPEGTYLLWLDCRKLNIENLGRFFIEKSKVWLHDGKVFGRGGNGFVRMNIACPRKVVGRALENMLTVI